MTKKVGIAFISILLTILGLSFQNCSEKMYSIKASDKPFIEDSTDKILPAPQQPAQAPLISVPAANNSVATDSNNNPIVTIGALFEVSKSLTLPTQNEKRLFEFAFQSIESIDYICTESKNPTAVTASGTITPAQSHLILDPNLADLHCVFQAHAIAGAKPELIERSIDSEVDCGNDVKDKKTGKCYICKHYIELADAFSLLAVPERNLEGTCYYKKLISEVDSANNSSSISITDTEIQVRKYEGSDLTTGTTIARRFAITELDVKTLSERNLSLSSYSHGDKDVLVDNFLFIAFYNKEAFAKDPSSVKMPFFGLGSQDCEVLNENGDGKPSTNIIYKGNRIAYAHFSEVGRAAIPHGNRMAEINANEVHHLEIRAMDCGAAQYVSDVYLIIK